ncbi:MAG TPA: TPM domain-containing protein [Xanthomonadaceae bacterium]|nr:TPM domain-containing protein [Xanthomonadaceae bacterium]
MGAIRARSFALTLISLLLFVGSAFANAIPVPPLTAHVTDQTGILSSAQAQALEAKLAAFEQDKGGQIAVLIVATTGDETIEQYSIRVVDQWKLGRKGVDDGVLLLVAKDGHRLRIEVGRGYEGVLPDAIANRIIDGFIAPKFHAGDYAGGLNDGVDRIIGVVSGEALPQPAQLASSPAAEPAVTGAPIPPLAGHVVNQTTLITYAQALYLDGKLKKFEADKGRKIAVLLASDIGNESCDDYARRVFKAWNLSSDGIRDDGVLMAECEQPFGDLIVVGRDLQGTITPALADRIHYEDMGLKLVGGDYVGAYAAGIDRIIDLENGKPMPVAKPENSFDWETAADWFSPPPLGTWTITIVGMIFLFFVVTAILGWKSALVRGGGTALAVGGVPMLAGGEIGFALFFAVVAFYLSAKYGHEDGPEPHWTESDVRSRSSVSGWSIFGSILGMVASSALSGGGGGGGGFRGGGGGFSGGGASGSW